MAFLQHSDSLFRVFVLSKNLRALTWGVLLDERRDVTATENSSLRVRFALTVNFLHVLPFPKEDLIRNSYL